MRHFLRSKSRLGGRTGPIVAWIVEEDVAWLVRICGS